jgi:hypothetical protein
MNCNAKISRIHDYHLAMTYARAIARLPIDRWMEDIYRAESVGPVVDPSLFREYLDNPNSRIVKTILLALLEVKRVVEEAQPEIRKQIEKRRQFQEST